jgi:hypothetical protein
MLFAKKQEKFGSFQADKDSTTSGKMAHFHVTCKGTLCSPLVQEEHSLSVTENGQSTAQASAEVQWQSTLLSDRMLPMSP